LGSFTAASLVQTGVVDRLRLIDPQELDVENVQRHYCGMSYIDQPKVESISSKLRAHFPHADCEIHQKDVLEIIRTRPADLVPSSLSIVTVGDIAIERRLNRVFNQGQVFGDRPICFMWAEPFMFAGHAILVSRGSSCFECAFDEEFRFQERVVSNADEFSRREAGCQTTFVPYSGLDVSEFVVQAVRFLLKNLDSDESLVFSWIGDIDQINESQAMLREQWKHTSSFSTRVKTLARNPVCSACGDYEQSLPNK
jgi:molybdopterin/thiamine biosynthesis adenylyltransferase